ncbi:MAG: hypothetical protein EOP85_02070 [Verrucomicrobiaceae bacterium]|nr:MAG: hypothetical protein EOP85_02070 [Verrucomicrobiaceae bacterium]
MRVSRYWTCFLTGLSLVATADAAQSIDWYSPSQRTNLTSSGAAMDGNFQFQLGVFSTGFVPTTANMVDWAANWIPADSSTYNPAVNARSFGSFHTLTGNVAPFTVGAKAYVWGRGAGSANDEWILFRATSWTWPAASLTGPSPFPLDWSAATANEVILGTVNASGSPSLMQSVAVVTYQNWRNTVLAGQPLNGPTDDPDKDGVPNILEYLFNTSPVIAGAPTATPVAMVDVSGQKYLEITIPRLRERLVSLTVEVSSDLVTWQSGASATTVVSNTSTQLVVRDQTAISAATPKRFMRLKAVLRP